MSDRRGSAANHDTDPARPSPRPPVRQRPRLLRQLSSDPAPVLEGLRGAHGTECGLGAGPVRLVIVGDAAAARELLVMPADGFRCGHRADAGLAVRRLRCHPIVDGVRL